MNIKWITYFSMATFLASLFFPAFIFGKTNVYSGFGALIIGPLGVLSNCIAWFANPFLLFSWISGLEKNYKKALILSIVSALIALSFFLNDRLVEGSSGYHQFKRGNGYYLWLASIFLCVGGNFYGFMCSSKKAH